MATVPFFENNIVNLLKTHFQSTPELRAQNVHVYHARLDPNKYEECPVIGVKRAGKRSRNTGHYQGKHVKDVVLTIHVDILVASSDDYTDDLLGLTEYIEKILECDKSWRQLTAYVSNSNSAPAQSAIQATYINLASTDIDYAFRPAGDTNIGIATITLQLEYQEQNEECIASGELEVINAFYTIKPGDNTVDVETLTPPPPP